MLYQFLFFEVNSQNLQESFPAESRPNLFWWTYLESPDSLKFCILLLLLVHRLQALYVNHLIHFRHEFISRQKKNCYFPTIFTLIIQNFNFCIFPLLLVHRLQALYVNLDSINSFQAWIHLLRKKFVYFPIIFTLIIQNFIKKN